MSLPRMLKSLQQLQRPLQAQENARERQALSVQGAGMRQKIHRSKFAQKTRQNVQPRDSSPLQKSRADKKCERLRDYFDQLHAQEDSQDFVFRLGELDGALGVERRDFLVRKTRRDFNRDGKH